MRILRVAAHEAGLELVSLRDAGAHEVLSLDGLRIVVPRHREIAEGTARSILRQAAERLGQELWR
jgi:predicted RNA binding protein YcfA (HicA-like mRNA interferase family)